VPEVAYSLINHIIGVLKKFNLHNHENLAVNKSISFKNEKSKFKVEKKEKIKAFSYGATAQTYLLEKNNLIIKAYNDKLRWTTIGHDDSFLIFSKELEILKKGCGPKMIGYNEELRIIKMEYCGESLYNNFELPKDWKEQVTEIFMTMSNKNIFYPEFHIQNLLVLGGKITFVDFGLAKIIKGADNTENCNKFIYLLTLLKEKFSQISDREERYQLYSTFVVNMKINNQQHH
jgi:hypothetical protein